MNIQPSLCSRGRGINAVLITLVLLVAGTAAAHLRAAPSQDTVVHCEPELIVSTIGAPISFTIIVDDVVDFYGADVQMAFDPTITQVVDGNPSKGGTQIEMLGDFLALDFIIRDVADNVAGTIWYANTQVNPTEAVSGSGALARVTLQPQAAGTFDMAFTAYKLVMRTGAEIPSIARDCRVTILDPDTTSKTYLPATIAE